MMGEAYNTVLVQWLLEQVSQTTRNRNLKRDKLAF